MYRPLCLSANVPSLERAATELGEDGFSESRILGGRPRSLILEIDGFPESRIRGGGPISLILEIDGFPESRSRGGGTISPMLEYGDGFSESRSRGGGPFGRSASLRLEGGGGPIDVGGVARLPRLDIVGEKGGSDLFAALY